MLQFKKAEKSTSLLRCAVFGPPGAGKTYTSLRMATGMGGKIAVIDTERGSASKYADRFDFDVLELPETDINTYVEAMELAAKAGYEILIIDSLSHAWQELLSEIDRLAAAKYRGNTWSAWSEGTPKQKKLVNAILSYPGHIIATMRSKIEYSVEQTNQGKTKPIKVGLAPEQGKGIEYEFDLLIEITQDHYCTVSKDRTGKFQDKIYEKPDESFGKELIAWLKEGKKVLPNQKFVDSVKALKVDTKTLNKVLKEHGHKTLESILDRETQAAVYLALKEGPVKTEPKNEPDPEPQAKEDKTEEKLSKEDVNFYQYMSHIKKKLNELTGSDKSYYEILGKNGFEHCSEIRDSETRKVVYNDLAELFLELSQKEKEAASA